MIPKNKLLIPALALGLAFNFAENSISAKTVDKISVKTISKETAAVQTPEKAVYTTVLPLELVDNPPKYLNQKIKIAGIFNKFSMLGLDYQPVNKSSKDYIGFLIQRPDVAGTNYVIPLSELKILIKREKAEKLIELESGNRVEILGKVISNALGDPWVEADEIKMLDKPLKK